MTPRLAIHADPPLSQAADRFVKELIGDALVTEKPNCTLSMTEVHPNYRGNTFNSIITNGKTVQTFHPKQAFKRADWLALMKYDIRKALSEAGYPELRKRERRIMSNMTCEGIVDALEQIRSFRIRIGFDTEGTKQITSWAIAFEETHALYIPFRDIRYRPVWFMESENLIFQALKSLLEDPQVPKVCHHAQREFWVCAEQNINIQGVVDDSELLWAEFEPELEKSLNTVASVLTDQNYWGTFKDCRTEEQRALYNCTDAMVTLECADKLLTRLDQRQLEHYRHRMALLPSVAWQEKHGIRYDLKERNRMRKELEAQIEN